MVDIDVAEAVAAWRLVIVWFLVGVAGLLLTIFFYGWLYGR